MKIEITEFRNLFAKVYNKTLRIEKVDELFGLLDEDDKGYLVILP